MYTRWMQGDGHGLFYKSGLDFDKLTDGQYFEIEELFLKMQQPPRDNKWGDDVVFAFTKEGAEKFKKLIALARKISRTGSRKIVLDPVQYDIIWESGDGQVALKRKVISKRMLQR